MRMIGEKESAPTVGQVASLPKQGHLFCDVAKTYVLRVALGVQGSVI